MKRLFLAFVLFLVSALAIAAGPLSSGQLQTLKTLVQADPIATALANAADDVGLAAWLNTGDATYTVWRTDVTIDECNAVIVWTEVDGLTAGKARIWEWMKSLAVLNASRANIRQGILDAFASATATRTALTALAKRLASRAEKALASGTGTNASPATLTWEGQITYADASLIRS